MSKRHLVSPVGRIPPGAHLRMQKASPSSCEGMRKTLGLEDPTQQEFRRRIYLRPSVEFFNRADALFRPNSNGKTAKGSRLAIEVLMKHEKPPISEVQTLKFKRDELFRNFEVHPGKLGLAREIKDIDDQIAELNAGEKKARADSPK